MMCLQIAQKVECHSDFAGPNTEEILFLKKTLTICRRS